MLRRLIIAVSMALLLAGCSTYHSTGRQQLEALPQHYSQFDLKLAWDTKVVGNQTLIEGMVQNVRYASMHDLEIWVTVLDPAGKVVARAMTFVIPMQLRIDETAEFGVKLPVAVTPGMKLRFTYKYTGNEGGSGTGTPFGGGSWMQSFDAVTPAR